MEKIQMIENSNMSPAYSVILNNNSQIRRTRQNLIILLSLCLVISLCLGISISIPSKGVGLITGILQCIPSIIFYCVGLICAYRYSSLGLRIFALINVISLIITSVVIVIVLFAILPGFSSITTGNDLPIPDIFVTGAPFIVFIFILVVISSIIWIIMIKLSFKLAQLINDK